MSTRTKPTYDRLGIAVIQPDCNGWKISYNPDDSRWYVNHPTNDGIVRNYADRRNALQFARRHSIRSHTMFKPGKENVVTVKNEEIAKLQEEISRLRMIPLVTQFAERLGHNMLVILAATPYEQWPDWAKDVFKQTEKAQYYKDQLPS